MQGKLAEAMAELLFDDSVAWYHKIKLERDDSDDTSCYDASLAWRICYFIWQRGNMDVLRSCLQLIFKLRLIHTTLKDSLQAIQYACSLTDVVPDGSTIIISTGAWTFLEALLEDNLEHVDFDLKQNLTAFVLQSWHEHRISRVSLIDRREHSMLNILRCLHDHVILFSAEKVMADLNDDVLSLKAEPEYVIAALRLMLSLLSTDDKGLRLLSFHCENFLSTAHQALQLYVETPFMSHSPNDKQLSPLIVALFTIGSVVLLGFDANEDGDDSYRHFNCSVSDTLYGLIKLLMTEKLPSFKSNEIREIPSSIRAQAFLTMGKICLRNKRCAKENIHLFLRELQNKNFGNDYVRSNAVFVLADICKRNTSIVEPYMDTLFDCLHDTSAIVKRNTLIVVSQLLSQDFIQWKPLLIMRLLVCLVDDSQEYMDFAQSILHKLMGLKSNSFYSSYISELILVLNKCHSHPLIKASLPSYSNFSSETHGQLNHRKRYHIYSFILADISEEEKISITAKIISDIISDILEHPDLLAASRALSSTECVLDDIFYLLECPELKVGLKGASTYDDDELMSTQEQSKREIVAQAKAKVIECIPKRLFTIS